MKLDQLPKTEGPTYTIEKEYVSNNSKSNQKVGVTKLESGNLLITYESNMFSQRKKTVDHTSPGSANKLNVKAEGSKGVSRNSKMPNSKT